MTELELPPPGWSSANDIDVALKTLHLPAQALADWYRGWAEALDEAPGLDPVFAEAAREAAGQIRAIADRVEETCATGIMAPSSPAPASPRYREANVPFVPAAVPLPGQVRLRRPGSAPPPKLPWGERLDAQNQVHPRAKRAYRRARRAQRRAQ